VSLFITEAGADKAKEFLEKRGSGLGLRVAITTTGCSGYAYQLEFADRIEEDDLEFFSNGIKLIVDNKSLVLIDGTEIDYVVDGLNEGFEFNNPLTKAKCGCGESFTV
jgi:iron-sulfur cluster assembly protein